ncbi:RNA polymerase sigma-70 factor, ECF family [Hyphomonas neptunium ATCC 15444]|uniref:RNA polymerase sigma-70 factor, ECF family n=1 Tax=Hyphomonas neptunium (strain ATCC 15444) TaxID=228405 RepID=Q0C430_HYPNA|nr:RNA polymerase sigma-70 factor, ECF family [Hyphomonas neptunium ATCC 15444]
MIEQRSDVPPKSANLQSKAAGDYAEKTLEAGTSSAVSPLTYIFRTQYRQLLRFCRIRVRNDADAEDIVQGAFLAARRAYPDKGTDELRPLLFTLVRNTALSHLRAPWSKRHQGEDIGAIGEQLACPASPNPEKQLMDAERLAIAEAVVSGMSARRQAALRLHRYEGLSYEEIARRLSISSTAVKKHVARAVAEIAARLAEAEDPAAHHGDVTEKGTRPRPKP